MIRLAVLSLVASVAATAGASAQSPAQRGGYLVNGVGVCGNCHTPRGAEAAGKFLAGGTNTFNNPVYTVRGSNLTPDPETGLGKWSDADIKRALVEGKRPNGQQLAPNMPYPVYGVLTASDLDAIVAYLRSIPAVNNAVQAPVYRGEVKFQPYPAAAKPMTDADLNDPVKRGAYLAAVGHCVSCHSRPNEQGVDFTNGLGAGGRKFGPQQAVTAANITSHPSKGIGGWSDAELKKMLTEGVSRDGRKLNAPMVEFAPYYKTMTDADLGALIAWMRSLPPAE